MWGTCSIPIFLVEVFENEIPSQKLTYHLAEGSGFDDFLVVDLVARSEFCGGFFFFFQDLVFDVVSSKKNSLLDCFVDVHLSFCTTSLPG